MKKLETFIKHYGNQTNLWYIDIEGVDQKGRTVWLSGNVLNKDDFGFGGFHDYYTCKEIVDNFENAVKIDQGRAEFRYSEDGVKSFTPLNVYIGYSPLDIYKDNHLFLIRKVGINI